MDKFKAWIEDKKNLPVVATIAGVVVIGVVVVMLMSFGVIGGGGGADTSTASAPGMAAGPAAGAAGPVPPGPGPAGMPMDAGAVGPTGAAPAAATAPTPAGSVLQPMLPYRKDPFLPFAGMPSRKDVLAMVLPALRRPRIAPAPVMQVEATAAAAEVLPPQPFRRMAGVMWNGRVSAILETAGETDIVRPRMELNRGNSRVRVESITQDSIVLKTLDTRTPMTITVGLAGSVTGNSATGTPQGQGAPDMYNNAPY